MRAMNRALIPLSSMCLWSVAVAQQKQLQPMDMFRLNFFMNAGAEDPVAWLDADNYLVFDAGKGGRGAPSWARVAALTGDRANYIDKAALLASLGKGVDAGALADPSAWIWNEDHTRFVLNVGKDLYSSGLDGKAVPLTKTPDSEEVGVRFSPDGNSVAFIANYNLHVVKATGGDVRALTTEGHSDLFYGRLDWVYQEELYGRGNFQGYWWSPDSKQIALLKLDESPVEEFVLVSDMPARPTVERTNYPKVGEPNPIVDIGTITIADGK
ncbi:MAG: dipeptidyl-peptidase-4, partial [Planctomycetota bacterium]